MQFQNIKHNEYAYLAMDQKPVGHSVHINVWFFNHDDKCIGHIWSHNGGFSWQKEGFE